MCGIAGFFSPHSEAPTRQQIGGKMAAAITHRGPDDAGVWTESSTFLCLAHRRLSILDLSPAGHQPMVSACGRYVLVFNGEIYNHLALRDRLQQQGAATVNWRGRSDTETLLAAFATWGVEATLQASEGMFAIALWDREASRLTLARDRMGEKPLYYGLQQGSLLFGSELKALYAHPSWSGNLDRGALTLFMRFGYVPTPFTIWAGIFKLPPGSVIEFDLGRKVDLPKPRTWWSTADEARAAMLDPITDAAHALKELEILLRASIQRQSLSDVPLGAFLSGGIDSSTVVALMQSQTSRAVQTFSIGFHESDYNEAHYAKDVAKHLGTQHTELYVTPEEALDVIPRIPHLYDEPFADSSQIPTYLVAALARRHITVALSGDAGDELFGGYTRYQWGRDIWARTSRIPIALRRGSAEFIRNISIERWNRLYSLSRSVLPRRLKLRRPGDQVHKLAGLLDAEDPSALYRRLVSQQQQPERTVVNGYEPQTWAETQLTAWLPDDFTDQMMLQDQLAYMADDILTKVDRAAMASGLETRIPMLDSSLIRFSWRLARPLKVRNREGKWLLRQLLYRHVPRELIDRPKAGFAVPIDAWLRGPLRDWAEDLLSPAKIRNAGLLDDRVIVSHWNEHLLGRRNHSYWLWNVLMFQSWQETWRGP